ncbi:hypothetical protein CVT26_001103 [Gymnopilus dilepis]|uniref:Cytochrome P450 n=1 Tax=Gymnopilus dilepis TaxID=231916 RepID=A0A409W7I2_9AGAR|nr:hypothetical protein CVT26_001103 [Gymnopilus dilepis]
MASALPFYSNFGVLSSSRWLYGLLAAVLVVFMLKLLTSYRRLQALPPGPRGFPIIGNIFQVPLKMPWFKFSEWAQEFGPVFSLNMMGQPIIVLNTFKAGADLLDRRSNIYSDRPRFIMAGEILSGGLNKSLLPYGNLWRKMRRASHEGFSLRSAGKYQPIQAREASLAAIQILEEPEHWEEHLERAAASGILGVVYGRPPIKSSNHPIIKRMRAYVSKVAASVVPGAHLVDIIPALNCLPASMAKWKREGVKWHEEESERIEALTQEVESKMVDGKAAPSFVMDLIERKARHGMSDKEIAWLAGNLLSAGADTTAGSLVYFVLAMVLYPEVMRKAQAELDNIVGRGRVPAFEDQKDLPYVDALAKEVLRWRPVAPIAIPRTVSEDNWYEGYLIPKGAIVVPNIWLMNRDPVIFPDYEEFRPERFLNGTPDDTHAMGHTSFGFGRRMCVGYSFANQMLYIVIAKLLWSLTIEKVEDTEGTSLLRLTFALPELQFASTLQVQIFTAFSRSAVYP